MAKLYFYYAAMNAGKTTLLLQSSYNYQERGMETLLYTPDLDNRYQSGTITSRIGLQYPAFAFDRTFDFFFHAKEQREILPTLACVLIDEGQFLSKDQVLQLTQIVDILNLPVLVYGLRTDFKAETFEGSQALLAWADDLIELKTICHCGRKAIMNARIDEQGQIIRHGAQVEIGGNDRYVSLCRRHYDLEKSQKIPLDILAA